MNETMTVEIKILTAERTADTLIPEEILREDMALVQGIHKYCQAFNLRPIYIHNCVAIFADHYLIAVYPEEVD